MKQLISLSARVEEGVKRAVRALEERDMEAARGVMDDDVQVDELETDIEEECLKIFALHQPVAIDLRYLVAALKINNDLERIGDLAVNIARHTTRILKAPALHRGFDIRPIYQNARDMLKKSLDAIVGLDVEMAFQVMREDDEVDRQYSLLTAEIIAEIKKNPERAEVLLQYIHIIRNLERVADHATNIAEDLIYLINGEIVRHQK